jgi:hypothetical protein
MRMAQALWVKVAVTGLPTGLLLWLYWWSAAPGLTWAHHGADGGDLIAAAVVNGVPHPSGYPLFTLLLRGWLWVGRMVDSTMEIAYWSNRLSALCAAGAVALTVAATAMLLERGAKETIGNAATSPHPLWSWLWALLAGVAFALTPLLWSQALITEVYGLHALLVAAMGWAVLNDRGDRRAAEIGLGLLMGLGAANHLTSLLLWPALLYWRLHRQPRQPWLGVVGRMVGVALLVAVLFYAGLLWRVASAAEPIPIAWGYPGDGSGLWWLVSGTAYRAYLFSMTPLQYGGRLAAMARLLVEQFTPVGLALVLGGFGVWDRRRPFLRNGALLWILPVSLYAAGYNTVDSYIYLLPVLWLMTLMLGQGLASGSAWLALRFHPAPFRQVPWLVATLAAVGLFVLAGWRLPQVSLRSDNAAQAFLEEATTTLEAGSLVITSADAPTFALWYGQWGSGQLAQAVPRLIIVNHSLYQFGWYRKLMHDLYSDVPMMGAPFRELIAANRSLRPIFLAEPLPEVPSAELRAAGSFWRLTPP